jgi:hypothetical protein
MEAMIRNLVAVLAVGMGFGALAVAGPFEAGLAAYKDRFYAKAAELWQPLAEKGNAAAQYHLGILYADGKGVEKNDATAVMWFLRAAEQGDAIAQYDVGTSYFSGTGVQKNDVEAAKWFLRAANQGMEFAQLNIGLLYAAGNGVPQDNVEAFKWLELAFFSLPAGGPRSDVARAMTDVAEHMTREQIADAKQRERKWKAKPEVKQEVQPAVKQDVKPEAK